MVVRLRNMFEEQLKLNILTHGTFVTVFGTFGPFLPSGNF